MNTFPLVWIQTGPNGVCSAGGHSSVWNREMGKHAEALCMAVILAQVMTLCNGQKSYLGDGALLIK